jgi:LacI family transcriptional regulator
MKTIKDVAAAAGVSVASVSRAMNAPETVSPETLERIRTVIRDLGYAPNKIARSLKAQTSKSVAVIVPDISNPFHLKVIKGAESVLAAAGYTLFIMDTEESAEKESRSLRDLLDRQIDGLVYIPVLTNRRLPRILIDHRIPLVFVDRFLGTDHDCVRGDNVSGISLLISHLMAQGRRRIALIGGPDEAQIGRERNQAFRTLVRQFHLDDDPALVKTGSFTVDGGYRLTRELIEANLGIDGLVVASNLLGIGALKALRDLKIQVPGDLDLAVFDEVGDLVDPPVTHVRQQAHEMGAQATRFLLERIQGLGGLPRLVKFEPQLMVSYSTTSSIR